MIGIDRARVRDAGITLGAKAIHRLEGLIASGSKVGVQPVLGEAEFPWVRNLEENWKTMRQELDAVLEDVHKVPPFQELSRDQRVLTTDDGWRTFFFYAYGFKAEANCLRCPETTRLIETIPDMTTAFFSIFAPGKHLPPHRGTFKGLLRYHLALRVPEPNDLCGIRIADQVYHWQEGRSLIFDDTFQHEAWNHSEEMRVVLFVDFIRPLKQPARLINQGVIQAIKHSPFVKDAVANYKAWDARLDREA